jgi:ubiquinone/menaquinone biosynthesis C-methylase UbiE
MGSAKVLINSRVIPARAIFNQGPVHIFYQCFAPFEWGALLAALGGRAPESVAILGSGALPETGIWIAGWARANGQRVHVHNVEVVPDRLELSRRVYEALGELDTTDVSFEVGNARDSPADLSTFEAVYFNATLGATAQEKESILIDVANRMRKGAYMVTRSTYSLKTMAYPVSQPSPLNLRLAKWETKQLLTLVVCYLTLASFYSVAARTRQTPADRNIALERRGWKKRQRECHHFQGFVAYREYRC